MDGAEGQIESSGDGAERCASNELAVDLVAAGMRTNRATLAAWAVLHGSEYYTR